jgi:glycosyltransferase involved in cell wall biosynthesis
MLSLANTLRKRQIKFRLEKYKVPGAKRHVLSITLEPISQRMAGPAIRCVELSKQLAKQFKVTVFSPRPSDITAEHLSDSPDFNLVTGTSKSSVYELARQSDILFLQGNVLKAYPLLARLDKYVVVDLYDPFLLAVLAQFNENTIALNASYNLMHQVLERHMAVADFSICASERQRDYWLGRYCALGRLTPDLYRFDRSFRKLIDVVPFGLPEKPAVRNGPGMKGNAPGITTDDFVLLWGGGIWEWFDPLTVVEAVSNLVPKFPKLKLYFLGTKSPNPQVPVMDMALRVHKLAETRGTLGKNVFFCDTWTSYEDRVNYLLDADVTVSAHFDLPETRFSFRTRILDYLWTGRPILTTCGDQLADMIAAAGAGEALPYNDVKAWERAIENLMQNEQLQQKFRAGSQNLSQQFHWENVCRPLAEFCANPHHLPKYRRLKMPSLVERARAVYSRGGKDLVLRRSQELLADILRK